MRDIRNVLARACSGMSPVPRGVESRKHYLVHLPVPGHICWQAPRSHLDILDHTGVCFWHVSNTLPAFLSFWPPRSSGRSAGRCGTATAASGFRGASQLLRGPPWTTAILATIINNHHPCSTGQLLVCGGGLFHFSLAPRQHPKESDFALPHWRHPPQTVAAAPALPPSQSRVTADSPPPSRAASAPISGRSFTNGDSEEKARLRRRNRCSAPARLPV